jgi:hypothetical protein
MLDNSFVQTSSTPISRRDGHGNSYQNRTLDDGSVHEVLKNFPTPEEARALLGASARRFNGPSTRTTGCCPMNAPEPLPWTC